MMKRIFWLFLLLVLVLQACEMRSKKSVKYVATDAISGYDISYRNESGNLVKKRVEVNSALERWEYSFIAEQGDIVYVSGNYKDVASALKIMILIDGKIFKQAATRHDTVRYVTVSGVIPY
jgi:hypothetical protein